MTSTGDIAKADFVISDLLTRDNQLLTLAVRSAKNTKYLPDLYQHLKKYYKDLIQEMEYTVDDFVVELIGFVNSHLER